MIASPAASTSASVPTAAFEDASSLFPVFLLPFVHLFVLGEQRAPRSSMHLVAADLTRGLWLRMGFAGVDGIDPIDFHCVDTHGRVTVGRVVGDRSFAVDDFAHGGDGLRLGAFDMGPNVTVKEAISESDNEVSVAFGFDVVWTHTVGKPMHARTT